MWLRAFVLTFAVLAAGVARAQAPPPSFFAERSPAELRALAADPHADVLVRRGAATKLVTTLADRGALDDAEAAAREFSANIDPGAPRYVLGLRRRARAHVAAIAAMGIAVGAAIHALLRARRTFAVALAEVRRFAPRTALFFAAAALGGGWLASRYENGSPAPFLLFGALMVPLVMLFRAWGALGDRGAAARAARAAVSAAAAIALGFLVLEVASPAFLAGYGL